MKQDKSDPVVKDVQWVPSKDIVTKRDEQFALLVYRVIRLYWQFFLGLVIGFLLGAGVFK